MKTRNMMKLSILGFCLAANAVLYAWPAVDDIAKKCGFDATSQKAYQSCSGWQEEDLANRIVSSQESDSAALCLDLRAKCGDDDVARSAAYFTRDETNCADDDYVMIDNRTGLMWLGNANHFNEGYAHNWDEAKNDVDHRFNYCGYDDWRLPSIDELEFLANISDRPTNLLNKIGFISIREEIYWSSSGFTYGRSRSNFYLVEMRDGDVGAGHKDSRHQVLPVRGPVSN